MHINNNTSNVYDQNKPSTTMGTGGGSDQTPPPKPKVTPVDTVTLEGTGGGNDQPPPVKD